MSRLRRTWSSKRAQSIARPAVRSTVIASATHRTLAAESDHPPCTQTCSSMSVGLRVRDVALPSVSVSAEAQKSSSVDDSCPTRTNGRPKCQWRSSAWPPARARPTPWWKRFRNRGSHASRPRPATRERRARDGRHEDVDVAHRPQRGALVIAEGERDPLEHHGRYPCGLERRDHAGRRRRCGSGSRTRCDARGPGAGEVGVVDPGLAQPALDEREDAVHLRVPDVVQIEPGPERGPLGGGLVGREQRRAQEAFLQGRRPEMPLVSLPPDACASRRRSSEAFRALR